jgi:hypothetical protein
MQKIFSLFALTMLAAACAPNNIHDLGEVEKRKLESMLEERNRCLVTQVQQLDDGVTDASKIGEIASSKCGFYEENIQHTLMKDFGMELGPAWAYVNNLRMQTPTQLAEAVLMNRKAKVTAQ